LEKPVGVIKVSVLTLLVSFCLALLSFVIFSIGIPPASGAASSIILNRAYVRFPPFLAFFSFAASIVLFAGVHSKLLWRMMVVFWVVFFVYMLWWEYSWVWSNIWYWFSLWQQFAVLAISVAPLAYSLGCLMYFQKSNVKNYFNS
jgi:hypothetical protein